MTCKMHLLFLYLTLFLFRIAPAIALAPPVSPLPPSYDADRIYDESDLIVIGHVIGITANGLDMNFQIEEVIKGEKDTPSQITISRKTKNTDLLKNPYFALRPIPYLFYLVKADKNVYQVPSGLQYAACCFWDAIPIDNGYANLFCAGKHYKDNDHKDTVARNKLKECIEPKRM